MFSHTSYRTLGILPVEVKVKHLKHFGTSQCHPTCQHRQACESAGLRKQAKATDSSQYRLKKQQEALVTVEEAGVVVKLAQASPSSPSPLGLSIWSRGSMRGGGLIIGLPWLDATRSITAGVQRGSPLSASHDPTSRTAASAHLGTYTTHWSLQQSCWWDFFFMQR